MDAELLSPTPAKTVSDERRETILKVAYAAFLNDGYAATSMSSIAARVGGSKATLYYYFPSKEDLFLAVIDEKCRDAHAVIADVLADAGDFHEALRNLTDTLTRMILEEDRIAIRRLITAESARFSELGRGFYACGREKGIETLTEFFDRTTEPDGVSLLVVTTVVDDPTYLVQPFIVSNHFRKQGDESGWNPTPCTSR